MPFRLFLIFHFLLFAIASDVFAQCRVEGVVRMASGAPYAGITVQLDGGEYRKPVDATSGEDGRFVFTDVKAGTRVRVTALVQGRAVAQSWTLVTQWVEKVELTESVVTVSPNSLDYVLATDGPAGEIVGFVRSPDGSPASARVTINETILSAATDGAGRYSIGGLRAGITVDLHVSAPGFEPTSEKVLVPENSQARANFTLAMASAPQAAPETSTNIAALSPSADDGTIFVRPEQVPAMPSISRNDVVHAFQFLPAIAGTIDVAAPLFVRGGTPDQMRVTTDGITLYQMADLTSGPTPYNADAARLAELSKSPFGPLDGGQLSGAVRLTGTSATARPTGFIDVSAFGAAAQIQVPVGSWLSAGLSMRGSPASDLYADALEQFAPRVGEPVRDRTPRFAGGLFALVPTEPSYHDVNARFELRPSAHDRIAVSIYDAENESDHSYDQALPPPAVGTIGVPDDLGLPADAQIEASKVQRWTGRGWSGVWRRGWSPTASSTFTLARSEYSKSASQAWIVASPGTSQDYSYFADRGGSSGLSEANEVQETTFRADNTVALNFAHALSFGAEISSFEIGYTAQTEATRSTTAGLTSTLVDLMRLSDTGRVTTAFVHDSWRPLSRLILAPGARIVRYDAADATYFEPRVSASYQVRPDFRLTAGWSMDRQIVNRVVREDRAHGDGGFWALADGTSIPVARAQQAVGGLNVTRAGVSFDLSGFYKRFDDLTLFAPRLYTGMVSRTGTEMLPSGWGTATGVEAIVQYRTPQNVLWIGYTVSRVDNTFPTLEEDLFPASYDQLHEFKVVDSVEVLPKWSVSGSFVVGSGRPYTTATGIETVWFPTGAVVSQLMFGDKNDSRLPAYHRLDLSTQRDLSLGKIGMSIGATVFNVYDRKSVIAVEYDSIAGTLASHDVTQMGRAVNAFLRLRF